MCVWLLYIYGKNIVAASVRATDPVHVRSVSAEKDCQGQGDWDGHLKFYTAAEL